MFRAKRALPEDRKVPLVLPALQVPPGPPGPPELRVLPGLQARLALVEQDSRAMSS